MTTRSTSVEHAIDAIPDHSRGYGASPNDPRGLPTGLPGFGTPGAKPADEQKVKVVPRPTADAP